MNPSDPETAAIAGMLGAVLWVSVTGVALDAPDVIGALVFGVTFAAASHWAANRWGNGGGEDGDGD